jgi:alpha-L-fucosidase
MITDSKSKQPKLKTFPGGKLGKRHAEFTFSTKDFRFTQGKNGAVYAYCLAVPKPGEVLLIQSLGRDAQLLNKKITSVSLLGSNEPLQWEQRPEGLRIVCPQNMTNEFALGFKIVI